MTLDPIIPENYCRFFVKLKLHIMMLSLLRPCEPKHEYYVKFLSIVNPGLEVWSGTYANAKPDTTNRSIFFSPLCRCRLESTVWDLSEAVNVHTYLAWYIRTKKRCGV